MNTSLFPYLLRRLPRLLLVLPLLWAACKNAAQKPLDGKSREIVDSLTAEGIRLARKETDSLCLLERKNRMPKVIDSLKQIRLREIEEKMRTAPR